VDIVEPGVATIGCTIRGMKRLLTEQEAAEYLRRPVMTLRWWRQVQRGPEWIKQEGKVRYDEAALDQWSEANTHTSSVRATLEGKRVAI
jgi:hypothetical protein